jgi:uncharacterized SAM-binding protein YcdF (DUF218 family)
MKREYWLIFCVIQAIGAMAAFVAGLLQEPLSGAISSSFLLPGNLAWLAWSKSGHAGAEWSLWAMAAIAVAANVLLFTFASFSLSNLRRARRTIV